MALISTGIPQEEIQRNESSLCAGAWQVQKDLNVQLWKYGDFVSSMLYLYEFIMYIIRRGGGLYLFIYLKLIYKFQPHFQILTESSTLPVAKCGLLTQKSIHEIK